MPYVRILGFVTLLLGLISGVLPAAAGINICRSTMP